MSFSQLLLTLVLLRSQEVFYLPHPPFWTPKLRWTLLPCLMKTTGVLVLLSFNTSKQYKMLLLHAWKSFLGKLYYITLDFFHKKQYVHPTENSIVKNKENIKKKTWNASKFAAQKGYCVFIFCIYSHLHKPSYGKWNFGSRDCHALVSCLVFLAYLSCIMNTSVILLHNVK